MEREYLYSEKRDGELRELAEKLSTFKTTEEIVEYISQLPREDYFELLSFMRYDTERLKYEIEKERNKKRELLERKEKLLKEQEALKKDIESKFERANTILEVFGEKAFLFDVGKA